MVVKYLQPDGLKHGAFGRNDQSYTHHSFATLYEHLTYSIANAATEELFGEWTKIRSAKGKGPSRSNKLRNRTYRRISMRDRSPAAAAALATATPPSTSGSTVLVHHDQALLHPAAPFCLAAPRFSNRTEQGNSAEGKSTIDFFPGLSSVRVWIRKWPTLIMNSNTSR